MYNLLYKFRIPVLHFPITTTLTATTTVPIAEKLNTSIGLIYGVSIDTQGVDANNRTLITDLQATNLFLTLRQGSSDFLLQMRLNNLNFFNITGGVVSNLNPYRFLAVNIPGIGSGRPISLDQSFYANPTLITGVIIKLNFWYLTPSNVTYLQSKGAILPIGT